MATQSERWQRAMLMTFIAVFILLALLPRVLSLWMVHTALPWFYALALLPGIIGIANHLVVSRQYETDKGHDESQHRPTFGQMVVAASLLTGVFCIVARAAGE